MLVLGDLDEKCDLFFPKLSENLFQEVVSVKFSKLLRDGFFFAPVEAYITDFGEDVWKVCDLFIANDAESECPEEAITISSHLSICIDPLIHFFWQFISSWGIEMIKFFLEEDCIRKGSHWVFDGFEFLLSFPDLFGCEGSFEFACHSQ